MFEVFYRYWALCRSRKRLVSSALVVMSVPPEGARRDLLLPLDYICIPLWSAIMMMTRQCMYVCMYAGRRIGGDLWGKVGG